MPDATGNRRGADCNLLYGMLALQMNFVNRDALLAAMQTWVFDKARSLGQILQEQGRLTPERRQALDHVLAEHLRAHHHDAHKSLTAVAMPGDVRDELCALADADVHASLAATADPHATKPYLPAAAPEGGRYRILRPHARGGLGEVFVAADQELHREVALKEMQPRFVGDAESRGRFVQEAEITGGLEHPGIVPVYGLGSYADGRPFYAMRLIQGETLKEAIHKLHAGEPDVTLRGLLTRFVAVCNAIAYAHSRGVLHRDLKPANVMLGKYGETLVLDWGLAKAAGRELARHAAPGFDESALRPHSGDSSTETRMGTAVGTPSFMSPEQAAGRLERVGPESDVYGLGATLYAILTGQAPVEKSAAETLEKVRKGDWEPPRKIKKETPAALDAVCRKAMALKPEDRYPTALALAADIDAWLSDEPVAACAEPWAARALRWMRRRQKLVTAAAAIVVMAALALGVGVLLLATVNERERDLRATAQSHAEQADQQRDEAQRRRDEAWYQLYVANINLGQREWERGNLAHVRELLDQCTPGQSVDKDLRGWEWHYLERLCHVELRVFRGHAGAVRAVAYSPDGSRLATAGDDGTVRVWSVASGAEAAVLKGDARGMKDIAFSPDGSRLGAGGLDGTVRVWDVAGGKEHYAIKTNNPRFSVRSLAYSPDGSRLATAGQDGRVRLWDLVTSKQLVLFQGHRSDVYGVAYSPDGTRLASAGRDGSVRVWDIGQGRELHIFRGNTGPVQSVAYSPDGMHLAWAGQDGGLRVWDPVGGGAPRVLKGHAGSVYGLAYSRDGLHLASAGADGTVRVWNAVTGHEEHAFRGHTGRVFGLAYSPDGTRLASAGVDGSARLWDTARAEPRVMRGHSGTVEEIVYSPDGSQLTSTGEDGTVRTWETTGGQEVSTLKVHEGWVNGLAYSPGRTRLITACGDGMVRIWDLTKGGPPRMLKGHRGAVNAVARSPEGTRLATAGSDGTVRLWDAAEGTSMKTLGGQAGRILSVAYSPKKRYLAWAGDEGIVHVWDVVQGQEARPLRGHAGSVLHVAYSTDGSRLASAGADGTVRVWDTVGDLPPSIFKGHINDVNRVAFNPDASRLASAGDDGTLRIWDLAGGAEVCVLKHHKGYVDGVTFSPDGTRLASSGADGTVQIVDARPWTPKSQVEQEAHALVEGLFARPMLKGDVRAQIQGHKGITELVRRQALELAGRFEDQPERFRRACREVVRYRDAPPTLYRQALGWARTACALAPGNGGCLTTLGIAQYRLGQYAEALHTLSRAESLNQANPRDQPADRAFLAMAHLRLGHKAEALTALAGLRDLMKKQRQRMYEEALAFLAEAETLLGH
jgi:WD40 repeat protein